MLALKKNKKLVLCFILPPLIFYILLLIFPVLETFFLSFFKWKGVGGSQFKFVGMCIIISRCSEAWLSGRASVDCSILSS